MNRGVRWRMNSWLVALLLLVAVLPLSACGGSEDETGAEGNEPAHVEPLEGTDLSRITLTEDAAKRLDIQTVPVRSAEGDGREQRTVIPYSAVFYDSDGGTWAYANSEALTFARERIRIDRIDQDRAVLSSGPPPGTMVATVGVAELYGIESGVDAE